MSINYTPGALSSQPPELRTEFDKIRAALQRSWPDATLDVRHAEPPRMLPGMIANADGSDWNPGSGEGPYLRNKTNTAWIFLGAAPSFRNRLYNGNFQVNQRAVSGTVTLAAGAYGHDRWKAGAGGCTYTFAASGNDTVITISAGSLMQVIEDKNVEGGVYALTNRGTATARIAVNGAATSGAYSTASTATPLASAAATGNQTMTVEFSTGTIDRAQLEPGTVATPFERRPIGLETALCMRYFELLNVSGRTLASASGTYDWPACWKVTKRVTPAVAIFTAGITANISSQNLFAQDASGGRLEVIATAAADTYILAQVYSLSAEL